MSTKSKTRYLLYATCFLSLLFLNEACKTDESKPQPDPTPAASERLLLASTHVPGIKSVEYNADKTPKRYEINSSDVVDIIYFADSITYNINRKSDKVMDGSKVYGIENGLVKNVVAYLVDKKGKRTENYTVTYSYKDGKVQKEVVSQKGTAYASIEYIYDKANENLIALSEFDKDGKLQGKATYEYTDILDKSGYFILDSPAMEGMLFPRKAKYLAKKCISEDYINDAKLITTFTYQLDSQGYVISGKRITEGTEYSWTNTWQ